MNKKTARINQGPLQWSRSTLVSEVRLITNRGKSPQMVMTKWYPPMINNPVGEQNCTPAPPN